MTNIQLSEISELAAQLVKLEERIEKGEKLLTDLKEQHRRISEMFLPEKMLEVQMSSFKSKEFEICVKPFYNAHISEENKPKAFAWLRKTGNDGIIKNQVVVPFERGQDKDAKKFFESLVKKKLPAIHQESVHHSTLRSFVKEQLENAKPIPQDIFGVYVGNKTTVKLLK